MTSKKQSLSQENGVQGEPGFPMIEFTFLLQNLIIPNSRPWKLTDLNILCRVCPLLKGHLSHKVPCLNWVLAGADQIVEYLISRNRIDDPALYFKEGCQAGHVSIAILLYPLLNKKSISKYEIMDMFVNNCMNCHLDMAKWLYSTFNITLENVKKECIFRLSCEFGHIEVIQWLCDIAHITPKEAKMNNNQAFILSCENGHLNVSQWLYNTFHITREEATIHDNLAFRSSCVNGHLMVAQWLCENFCITPTEAKANNNEAFKLSCINGHLSVARWLHDIFHITSDEAKMSNNEAFISSCGEGHLEIAQWLHDTFHMTSEDAKMDDNREIGRASCRERV